ncbi:MAG: hypothetical protein ACKKMP_02640 [Candidatus Nealsonbacteria bacterium]
MDILFPHNLVSGSVKDQRDLDNAFLQYPNYSKAFVAIALAKPDIREWYENRWSKLKKHLDKDFSIRFQKESEHAARAWEFHLGTVLLERGPVLEEKNWKIGPDFCIKTPTGSRIWIEAIACNLGTTDPVEPMPVMVPGVLYTGGGNIEDDHRPRALRITSAIATKFEKYKNYLTDSRSKVSEKDCLIIAINGAAIQHFSESRMLFKRAVFGQGPDVYVKRKGDEKLVGPFYKPTPTITKKKKDGEEEIPAYFMEMDEFTKISAVIYCGHRAYDCELNGYRVGDDFLFAYHTNPTNPIPDGLFKFGRGIRKNPQDGTVADRQQS